MIHIDIIGIQIASCINRFQNMQRGGHILHQHLAIDIVDVTRNGIGD